MRTRMFGGRGISQHRQCPQGRNPDAHSHSAGGGTAGPDCDLTNARPNPKTTGMAGRGLSYEQSGVDYGTLDAFKRACQRAASTTTAALGHHHLSEPAGIRGESAYLLEAHDEFLAHVEEGLGTKNLVAD